MTDEPTNYADAPRAATVANKLYAGIETPHRSCGIAIAETFDRATAAYQALRRGGLTGVGECGAIVAGRLVLGELLGDPDPTGPATPELKAAIVRFEALWRQRLDRGQAPGNSVVCNDLTSQFVTFRSHKRHAFCTNLATTIAECVALALQDATYNAASRPT